MFFNILIYRIILKGAYVVCAAVRTPVTVKVESRVPLTEVGTGIDKRRAGQKCKIVKQGVAESQICGAHRPHIIKSIRRDIFIGNHNKSVGGAKARVQGVVITVITGLNNDIIGNFVVFRQ